MKQVEQDRLSENPRWSPVYASASSASNSSYYLTHTTREASRIVFVHGLWPAALAIWARGAAGPYSVIASYITAEKPYGHTELPVFMLARDGKLIADDGDKAVFEELGRYTDTYTGKPVGEEWVPIGQRG